MLIIGQVILKYLYIYVVIIVYCVLQWPLGYPDPWVVWTILGQL